MAEKGGEPIAGQAQIVFPEFEPLPAVYATNLVVQFTGQEFIVNFYGVYPPVRVAGQEGLPPPTTVPAHCVARIVVSTDRMPGFVSAFASTLEQSKTLKELVKDMLAKGAEGKKDVG